MFRKKGDEDRKPIEQEIAELQRKFRVLENDKRAYSEDSQGIIRKQRATIEKLTRDNKKMKSEISESRSSNKTGPEQRLAAVGLKKLADKDDALALKLDAEKENHAQITYQLDAMAKDIFAVREEMCQHGGCNAALENAKAVQKQIRVLENRLDKSVQNFNIAITANKGLRDNIDTLRRERLVFDDIYKKLENELEQKKWEMANIIEQANAAYEARDQAQAQMSALKQQADKEHSEFEKEWKELGRLIENDKRMKDYMKHKAVTTATSAPEISRERKAASKINFDPSLAITGPSAVSVGSERVASYEEAFSRIQAATGISEIDELVQTFINAEDQNYSFFKYNNLLREDIEKMEVQIHDYKQEQISLSGASTRKEDTERLRLLETLEERLSTIESKAHSYDIRYQQADSYDIRYQEAQQTLSHLCQQIDQLFGKLQCSPEDLPSGCGNGITRDNMMSYLAVIESQTSDILRLYDSLQEEDDEEPAKPRPQHSGTSLPIRLPSTVEEYSDDDDEDDEDDQRPFKWEELKDKVAKGITKRARKQRKGGGHDK